MSGRPWQPNAIVTGASRGLGFELAKALAGRGWRLVVDARGAEALEAAAAELRMVGEIIPIPGDIADEHHRRELVAAAGAPIDLLVNNASVLGPSPQPGLADYPLAELERVYRVNVLAPLALAQLALPHLGDRAAILNVTSDASVEAYEGWGGYGSSKSALDQLTAVLAVEHPDLRIYAVDPGDMRTEMHQQAFPGEDISDRPPPGESVPGLLRLIEDRLPSGRYRAADLGAGAEHRMSAPTRALPEALEAREAPERRGIPREEIRMMVARRGTGEIVHARFHDLPEFLEPGDLLVVNNSQTLPAALPGRLAGTQVELRLSTPLRDGDWVVELRRRDLSPLARPPVGARVELPAGAHAELLARFEGSERLSVARLTLGRPVAGYLRRHGTPIRYPHDDEARPIEDHQTVFALEPGSAEMPSAGRPFSADLVVELVARGIHLAPITLHAGVSSLESGERPYPERYRVPAPTARLVNGVRGWGGRVIAVGTTVVRALETVASQDGEVRPGDGHTSLVVNPERGVRAIDGLITGWHEPASSHLELLAAAAGTDLLERSYRAARAHRYRWHEFGDAHLILP